MKVIVFLFLLSNLIMAQREYQQWVVNDSMIIDFNKVSNIKLIKKHRLLYNSYKYFSINDRHSNRTLYHHYENIGLFPGFICDEKGQLMIYSDGRRVFDKNNILVDSNNLGFSYDLQFLVTLKYDSLEKRWKINYDIRGQSGTANASIFTSIVKKPGCNNNYYLFYTSNFMKHPSHTFVLAPEVGTPGAQDTIILPMSSLYYYEFEVKDEIYKRISETKLLIDSIADGFGVSKAKNNIDYWLIAFHKSNSFKSFKLTDTGIITNTVTSAISTKDLSFDRFYKIREDGRVIINYKSMIYKFNGQGDNFGVASINDTNYYLLGFDNKTGNVFYKNKGTLMANYGIFYTQDYYGYYGANFYSSYQYCLGNNENLFKISNSQKALDSLNRVEYKHWFIKYDSLGIDRYNNSNTFIATLNLFTELSPYNRVLFMNNIFQTENSNEYRREFNTLYNIDSNIAKIREEKNLIYNVDKYGWEFNNDIIINTPQIPGGFLGNHIYKERCQRDSLTLDIYYEVDESDSLYQWTGPNGFYSSKRNPILFNVTDKNTGWYTLEVYDKKINCNRKFSQHLEVKTLPIKPEIRADKPLNLCPGDSIYLQYWEGSNRLERMWSNGDTSLGTFVKTPGVFTLTTFSDRYCPSNTSVTITTAVRPTPTILRLDEFTCAKDTVRLMVDNPYSHYLWNTGDTTRSIKANRDGLFRVKVWNDSSMCDGFAEIYVRYETKPKPQFISNTPRICRGDSIFVTIDPKNTSYYSYLWEDGNREPERWLSKQGDYKLVLIDNRTQCRDSNVFKLIVEDAPKVEITKSKALCNAESVVLSTNYEGSNTTYLWNNGATSASITTNKAGVYSCTVTLNGKCSGFGVFTLNDETISTPAILGDTLLCKGKTITLSLQGSYSSQTWSTGETTPQISLDKAGLYSVIVSNGSCTASSNVEVNDFINNNLIADIDFGDIELNGTYQKEVASNVKSARLKDGTNFILEIIGNKLILKAKPSTKGIQSDSLYVVYTTICNDSNSIQVKANVIESSPPITKIHLSIDDVKIVVGDTNNYLPIRIKVLDNPQNKERIVVRGKIATKNLILKPLREVYNRQNDSTYIEFSATYTTSSTNDILLNIKGIGLLDEVTKANYNFSIVEVDKNTELTTKDGTVEVSGICAPSLRLVTIFEPPKLTINPNPADNDVAISLESKLEGTHLLEVINSTGEIVFTKEYLPQSDKEVIYLSKVQISNGIYFVRFTPPYNLGSLQEKLIVR